MGPIITLVYNAYNLIKDPEHWTQDYYQKNKNGEACSWKEGYSFCALGALSHVSDEIKSYYPEAECIIQRHCKEMFNGKFLQNVNDSLPTSVAHTNVLRVFESVIEKFSDREPTEEELI